MSRLMDVLLKYESSLRSIGFDERQIRILGRNYADEKDLRAFAESSEDLNAETIMYIDLLGLTANEIEFDGCGKPKALVLYPTADPNKAFLNSTFVRQIKEAYDMKIRAIKTVNDMRRELRQSPILDLLVLGGHGTRDDLIFNGKSNRGTLTKYERLEDELSRIKENGVIFLDSCSNGEGRELSYNLANHIATCAPGRKVISCTEKFSRDNMNIVNLCPLEVKIKRVDPFNGDYDDCTYVAVVKGDAR